MIYRCGEPQTDGSISWSAAEQTIFTTGQRFYANIWTDSEGYPWIGYDHDPNGVDDLRIVKSSTNDGTWTTEAGFPYTATTDAVPHTIFGRGLLNGDVVIVWGGESGVYGKVYDGTWTGEVTITTTYDFELGSGGGTIKQDEDMFVFVFQHYEGGTFKTLSVNYTDSSGWGSLWEIYGQGRCPTIAYDSPTGDLYIFQQNGTGYGTEVILRKYANSTGTWGDVTVAFSDGSFDKETLEVTVHNYDSGYFGLTYVKDSNTLRFTNYTLNFYPTITTASIENMDNVDDLLPMYKWYEFKVVTNDDDGFNEISKVYLREKDGAGTIFEVRGGSLESTPSWSIQTGSSIIDLDATSSLWETSGTQGNATFKIRIEYDHSQYLNMELDAYVESTNTANSGWINAQTDYFDVITNLVTTFDLDDTRGNLTQEVTASGDVTFEGSILYPSDSNFTSVSVYDSGDNNKGTDNTIVNGQWQVIFNTPGTVGTETYNLYINMVNIDYPDGEEITPTETFINDRCNVTQFWASNYNPPTGENITLYAIFESEYDAHICDGDDELTIEDLVFTYDPIEEYFFTEVGYDEMGVHYFDTLNSIYENTYGITIGNLDYNLSITWGGASYEYFGLYYENGTYAGNVSLSVYFEDTIDTFTLEGEIEKDYDVIPVMVTWPLSGGASRLIHHISANETQYIFTPNGEYGVYSFTIKDYVGVIGKADSYLETLLLVNGSERLIERILIWDTTNDVSAILQKDNRYKLQIRDNLGNVHVFDYFLPAIGLTPDLIIDDIPYSDQVHYVGEYISVEALRPDYEHIRINYKDERGETTSIFVEICLMNGTQVWNTTSTENLVQFNWYDAVNTTHYLVNLVAQHELVDEVLYSNVLAGEFPSYDGPPDFSIFGKAAQYLLPVGLLLIILAIGDAGNAKVVTGLMVCVAYLLHGIGWLPVPLMGIHLSLLFTIAWFLQGKV